VEHGGVAGLALFVALAVLGCGNGGSTGQGPSDAGDASTEGGSVGAGCANPSNAHSEGSADKPVLLQIGALPFVGGIDDREGPSFYHLEGLLPGARYLVSIHNGYFYGDLSTFQTGFVGLPACTVDPQASIPVCKVVPKAGSVDIRVHATSPTGDHGTCFSLDAQLDSPKGAFEGATDDLNTLRFGTPDLPHRGIVDHDISYYRISQLTPGKRYTVWLTGLEQQVDAIVGSEDPMEGVKNDGCTTEPLGDADAKSCTLVATNDSFGVRVFPSIALKSSRFVLSVFEDFDSEGAVGAPLALSYAGGLKYDAHVGPRPSDTTPNESHYQVSGLTPGAHYLAALSDAFGLDLSLSSDAAFTSPVSCLNTNPMRDCDFAAPGSSIFVSVRSYDVHSRRFTLNVDPEPANEGSSSAPKALTYPQAFPYAGQTAGSSEYLIGPVPSVPYRVSILDSTGPVFVDAWPPELSTLVCVGTGLSCTVDPTASGQLELRTAGMGAFHLQIAPAPVLVSPFVHDAGQAAIPNGDATGLSDALSVSGASVKAIAKVTVELYVKHGHPSDLTAFLLAPDGVTKVKLFEKAMGPYEGVFFHDYALDPESGLQRDRQDSSRPVTPLYVLEGMDANGTWTLQLIDDQTPNISPNDGELLGWGLAFQ
jgi:subtilisin-like proprotein convertase family protein